MSMLQDAWFHHMRLSDEPDAWEDIPETGVHILENSQHIPPGLPPYDELEEIYRLHSLNWVTEEYGVSEQIARRWLRWYKIPFRPPYKPNKKAKDSVGYDRYAQALLLYEGDGKSIRELADELHVQVGTLRNWFTKIRRDENEG